ncbi:hypothetical protein RhiirA4_422324 [Rhizophagus irregularis]|uniref:DUF8211 domain-containing protein n=1 Tax=Rhizophagus irregularis TaxID=588596 RepID=A0A2I1GPS3_9GLOM|nr:hypothetical protein RhiirA4_422324 [Rhizophagus irregularis]
MYHKRLENFSIRQSLNIKAKQNQEKRFNRTCRWIFQEKNLKNIESRNLQQHRLIRGRQYRFLFLKSQYVNKPIKHLTYNQGCDSGKYNFNIPYFTGLDSADIMRSNILSVSMEDLDTTIDRTIATVKRYNPVPNMFIPLKYQKIIPKDLIYSDQGQFIVPGSREWPPGALDNTSNDTKRLELRPHKRKSSQQVTNFFSNRIDDNLKRRRTYPALTDDLSDAVAQPSQQCRCGVAGPVLRGCVARASTRHTHEGPPKLSHGSTLSRLGATGEYFPTRATSGESGKFFEPHYPALAMLQKRKVDQ